MLCTVMDGVLQRNMMRVTTLESGKSITEVVRLEIGLKERKCAPGRNKCVPRRENSASQKYGGVEQQNCKTFLWLE